LISTWNGAKNADGLHNDWTTPGPIS